MENSTFVTDAEITEYLNQELAELWSRLTQGGGQPHYRSLSTISVTAGTSLYALPSDFWILQGVEATIDNITGPLMPFMPLERGLLSTASPWGTLSPVRYRLQAGNIEFLPSSWTFSARVYYTQASPRLSAGSDTFDGFNGYEVAAIYGVCATLQAKEETDPSFYSAQRERIYNHIESLSGQRDMSATERVQDVISNSLDDLQPWWVP